MVKPSGRLTLDAMRDCKRDARARARALAPTRHDVLAAFAASPRRWLGG
jgi:hypothetical protein